MIGLQQTATEGVTSDGALIKTQTRKRSHALCHLHGLLWDSLTNIYLILSGWIFIIKWMVPVLDSDWLSRVRSCCQWHTPLFTLCFARQPLCSNHNCFWGTTLFGGRILFLLISWCLFALLYFVEALLVYGITVLLKQYALWSRGLQWIYNS